MSRLLAEARANKMLKRYGLLTPLEFYNYEDDLIQGNYFEGSLSPDDEAIEDDFERADDDEDEDDKSEEPNTDDLDFIVTDDFFALDTKAGNEDYVPSSPASSSDDLSSSSLSDSNEEASHQGDKVVHELLELNDADISTMDPMEAAEREGGDGDEGDESSAASVPSLPEMYTEEFQEFCAENGLKPATSSTGGGIKRARSYGHSPPLPPDLLTGLSE